MKNLRNCPPVTTSSSKSNNIHPIVVISCELTTMAVSQFKSMLCTRGLYSISDYNYILSYLSSQGYSNTILRLARMWDESQTHNNVFPNIDTWKILIDCHCASGNMSSAFSLFHNIIKAGHRPTASTLNYLFQGLCDRGRVKVARKVEELSLQFCKPILEEYHYCGS